MTMDNVFYAAPMGRGAPPRDRGASWRSRSTRTSPAGCLRRRAVCRAPQVRQRHDRERAHLPREHDRAARRPLARRAPRGAVAAPESRICVGRGALARARHRRQHRDLQPRQRVSPALAAGEEPARSSCCSARSKASSGRMSRAGENNGSIDPATGRSSSTSFSLLIFERFRARQAALSDVFAFAPFSSQPQRARRRPARDCRVGAAGLRQLPRRPRRAARVSAARSRRTTTGRSAAPVAVHLLSATGRRASAAIPASSGRRSPSTESRPPSSA